jgi:hypothetical protein
MRHSLLLVFALLVVSAGCGDDSVTKLPVTPRILPPPEPPPNPMQRLIGAYEQEKLPEYVGMFAGDFTYEPSASTVPTLEQQFSTGYFKMDERESAEHLFNGYTPPGGAPLPAAASIDIRLAVDIPVDDTTRGADPITHKLLATRVDGSITVKQSGAEPITYTITNNYDVFYLVRGDAAVNLDSTQPADAQHWYVYRWVDLTPLPPPSSGITTWRQIKAMYHGPN